MAHRVTAAAVQVRVGSRVHIQTRGAVLVDGVDKGDVERLVRRGLVAEVAERKPAVEKQDEPKQPARKPAAK